MRLDGFDVAVDGRLPTLLVEWDVAPAPPAVLLFSFRGVPRRAEAGVADARDWYLWSTSSSSSARYGQRDDGLDVYHCSSSACYADDFRTAFGGTLYVTLFTGYNVEATSAALTVTKLYSSPAIDADDLETVKRLWADNCAPWLAPPGWSWPVYMNTDYPYELGERDSRDKPYCDWWPSMTAEGLGAVASCDEIPGVECGADGSVRDLVLNDFGLRGALPADFALPRCEGDQFGSSVAVGAAGAILVGAYAVGTDRPGFGRVFEEGAGLDWAETLSVEASDGAANDQFGASVALGDDYVVVGSSNGGAAYVFGGGAYVSGAAARYGRGAAALLAVVAAAL